MAAAVPSSVSARALRARQRRALHRKRELLLQQAVITVLDAAAEERKTTRAGTKPVPRKRGDLDDIMRGLGGYVRKAYRMHLDDFKDLHRKLEPALTKYFSTNRFGKKRRGAPNGHISTQLRLSAAIRFFAGGKLYDIMSSHGMGRSSIYESIWGVVDVVNEHPDLDFNDGGAPIPTHDEQREIAEGFRRRSMANFSKVVMAIDGMLVWTVKPSKKKCREMKCGELNFHCYRKDKYGLILLAGCDDKAKFRWADMRNPGRASDYLAYVSSGLDRIARDRLLPGFTIIGDNAFIESPHMATPIPGKDLQIHQDAYNFYLSQLRITIERAFGILVHRWSILRAPLSIDILKVPALVMCLLRLHNWCIDRSESHSSPSSQRSTESNLRRMARRAGKKQTPIVLDSSGRPTELLGHGHHFTDLERGRRPPPTTREDGTTPMRAMIKHVEESHLKRPTIRKRGDVC